MNTKISTEFPFESHFIDIHGSKIHYVDEGSGFSGHLSSDGF